MKIKSAKYFSSCVTLDTCPPANKPEYAFIGRSNVGKSSLINMLCGISGLARISSRPGKTQLINHFLINDNWFLVDLPGYGFAKVSKEKRAQFDKMIGTYILGRKNLMNVFVLIDSRIEAQKSDLIFLENLAQSGIPFSILFTKTDKLSKTMLQKNISAYKKELLKSWEEMPRHFLTSAETRAGKEEVLDFIEETNEYFKK
ncbi:MAG TPA: ribosome biogenesis GTP-binding protein YihA/YsxC [Bacteroidia bacterium]|nr:ribosome biogenesis GTP-binding protein YihA/YsxC [Bacteroidia bacterium]